MQMSQKEEKVKGQTSIFFYIEDCHCDNSQQWCCMIKKKERADVRMITEVQRNKGEESETALKCSDSLNSSSMWKGKKKWSAALRDWRGKQRGRQ